jgi:hypothetical protein
LVIVFVYSQNNIRIIKSRRMRWEEYAAHIGWGKKKRNEHRGLVGRLKGKKPFGKHIHRRGMV